MMTRLTCDVIAALRGKTLAVAESCTGGMIGAALTSVPGSSRVFKGGVISYTNEVKQAILGVSGDLLDREGAVSAPVAEEMAKGARRVIGSDYAISVTGLAGPGGDEYGNPVGTVFIGFADDREAISCKYAFHGDREEIRNCAVKSALTLLLSKIK